MRKKKRKITEKETASAPSRFASLCEGEMQQILTDRHSGCLFFASDLMRNSTGYVIKQLVHTFSCALSSYRARGNFGERSRS